MVNCRSSRIVVVGNAGIGKSYMQVMILLWWAREALRPDALKQDPFFDKIKLITRLERGYFMDLFFKNDRRHYRIRHQDPPDLDYFDSASTLLLYEPLVVKDEIPHCGIIQGRVWSTVSPLKSRYEEFSKIACAVKYMECATPGELVFMASVLKIGVDPTLEHLYDPESVVKRITDFGPFQRVVLPTSETTMNCELGRQKAALGEIKAEELLDVWEITGKASKKHLSVSHYILRIVPIDENRYSANPVCMSDENDPIPLQMESFVLRAASNSVVVKLREQLLELRISKLRHILAVYEADPTSNNISNATKGNIANVLESFFPVHATNEDEVSRWSNWKVANTKFTSMSEDPIWEDFSLDVSEIDMTPNPTWQQIKASPKKLFYMNDSIYPFVDYFWFDPTRNTLNGGQASIQSSGHPKSVRTYREMLKRLELVDGDLNLVPGAPKLVINFIPLPSKADKYASAGDSKIFSEVGKDLTEIEQIRRDVVFRVVKMHLR